MNSTNPDETHQIFHELSFGGLRRVPVELGADPAESEVISGDYERFSGDW